MKQEGDVIQKILAQECIKKKEYKWTDMIAEQESVSDFIIDNISNWDKFPLSMKIQSLEQFNILIEATRFDEEDIVLKSNCNFIDQLKHNNPKIVWITLNNLISYTHKAQAINYNVPHIVSSLISKVMIRKEFREQTIQLIMLIFSRCRDGLNFGIQDIFSSTSPKPICETLYLFELLLLKKELEMKEFLKQYMPQIYDYTQNQYQEVRSSALKLFVGMIKEYGDLYVAPYKAKLKSNQIDFINKQLQKELQIQQNLNAQLLQKDYQLHSSAFISKPNSSIPLNLIKPGGGLISSPSLSSIIPKSNQLNKSNISNISSASNINKNSIHDKLSSVNDKLQQVNEKLSPANDKLSSTNNKVQQGNDRLSSVQEKPLTKQKISRTKLATTSSESSLKTIMKKKKMTISKDESLTSLNDLSKSRSSINSKISKKKHSETMSLADYDSSYEKQSELTMKKSREYSADLTQKKKVGSLFEKGIKADLPEILEAGIVEVKQKKINLKLDINRDKKISSSSVFKKEKFSAVPFKKVTQAEKPLATSLVQYKQKKFKSEQELKQKKYQIESHPKVQSKQISPGENSVSNFNIETPNGVDNESFYVKPNNEMNEEKQESANKKEQNQLNSLLENSIQQCNISQDFHNKKDIFLENLLHLNDKKANDSGNKGIQFSLAENDSSVQVQETPFGVDHESYYALPNLNADINSDEQEEDDDDDEEEEELQNTENILNQINEPEQFKASNKNIVNQFRAKSVQQNRTPNGIDCDGYYAKPNMNNENDDGKEEKEQAEEAEETQTGDALEQKQNQISEHEKQVKQHNKSEKRRDSVSSNQSTNTNKGQDEKEQKINDNKNAQNELVESLILKKQQSIPEDDQQLNKQQNKQKIGNNILHVVEEESHKQSGPSIGRQVNDLSMQMSFLNRENAFDLESPSNAESNFLDSQLIQSNYLRLNNQKASQFSSEPQINLLEEEKQNHNNFYQFKNDLSKQQQSQQNNDNYEIRGYFFNQDIKDILSVVESAEHKNYFFSQSQEQQQQQQPSSQFNNNLKEKDIFMNADNKKKGTLRSYLPQQSPFKRPQSYSLQRNIQDEEKEQAYKTINRATQMNDNVLKSYILVFNNKLVSKLNQQQKDKIQYIINKDNINQWFNSQEYDNVSIISFFILYVGKQFEKGDFTTLSRFWNFQKFLSFNNAMIQSQTIHVMHTYFKVIQKQNSIKSKIRLRCLRDTINKLIKIIPVSRDKLFDEAFAFLDFLFELDTYNNYIFDAISEVLQSNVPKQIVSSLRILSNFLRLYGEKRLNSLKPFMHIIKSISFSANLQVRNAAIEFYQEAYSWMGDSIFEYTKALKKSQLIQLEKAFSQVILKERRPLKCPEDVFCPIINNDLFEKQQNIFFSECDEEIQKQESYIRKALAVQEWVNKDDLIEKIVNDASCQTKLKEQNFSHLIKILLELIGDWNKYLIENTLILIRSLALKLKKSFSQGSIELFEAIFELYSEQKSINRDKISKALVSLFIISGLSSLQNVIEKLLSKKRNVKELLNVLNFSLRKTDAASVLKIIQDVQVYLTDKDSNTKIAAFDLFGTIRYLYGNPIIEQNISADIKNNRFILQKMQESHVKCAKMKSLSMQKKKLEDIKNALLSNSISTNSEMSTASYDKQYFYVQLQKSSSSKMNALPIQQFKLIRKQELLQKQLEESFTEIYENSFIHEFLSQSQMQANNQLDDIDEI